MWYSVHKLNIENHSHIIGRKDGVTGDSIKANDEIVFCASCQSVFLKDSWEYMGKKHCDQFRTLRFVPVPTPMLIIRNGIKVKEEIIFEFKNESLYTLNYLLQKIAPFAVQNILLLIASVVVSLLWIFIPSDAFQGQKTEFTLFLSLIIFFVSHYFKPTWTETKGDEIEGLDFINTNSGLKILETGILLGNNLYYYNQIARINSYKTTKNHKLVIELKDKQTITKELSAKDYERTKPFYLALAWAAQFVEINFYTKSQREYGLLKSIEQNYAGRIWVADNAITS